MDRIDKYREILERVLLEYEQIPYAYGEMRNEAVFDRGRDRFLLVTVGRDHKGKRVNDSLVHVDIIDGKLWIHEDGTEDGIAGELVASGIPKEHIVLAFQSPERRQYSGYAVA